VHALCVFVITTTLLLLCFLAFFPCYAVFTAIDPVMLVSLKNLVMRLFAAFALNTVLPWIVGCVSLCVGSPVEVTSVAEAANRVVTASVVTGTLSALGVSSDDVLKAVSDKVSTSLEVPEPDAKNQASRVGQQLTTVPENATFRPIDVPVSHEVPESGTGSPSDRTSTEHRRQVAPPAPLRKRSLPGSGFDAELLSKVKLRTSDTSE
jgi:hypothetical protein